MLTWRPRKSSKYFYIFLSYSYGCCYLLLLLKSGWSGKDVWQMCFWDHWGHGGGTTVKLSSDGWFLPCHQACKSKSNSSKQLALVTLVITQQVEKIWKVSKKTKSHFDSIPHERLVCLTFCHLLLYGFLKRLSSSGLSGWTDLDSASEPLSSMGWTARWRPGPRLRCKRCCARLPSPCCNTLRMMNKQCP